MGWVLLSVGRRTGGEGGRVSSLHIGISQVLHGFVCVWEGGGGVASESPRRYYQSVEGFVCLCGHPLCLVACVVLPILCESCFSASLSYLF